MVVSNHNKIMEEMRQSAEQGIPFAQYHYGMAFLNRMGMGLPNDAVEAVKWITKAADAEFLLAQQMLGIFYSRGKHVERNRDKAVHYLDGASKQGCVESKAELAVLLLDRFIPREQQRKGKDYLLEAVEANHIPATFLLGSLLINGDFFDQDIERGIKIFKVLAENDLKEAVTQLAIIYLHGFHVEQDVKLAIQYMEKSVKLKDKNAMYYLARMYLSGVTKELGCLDIGYSKPILIHADYLEQDTHKGVALLVDATNSGHLRAMYHIGVMLLIGENIQQDRTEAIKLLKQAKAMGSVDAAKYLETIERTENLTH